MGKHIIFLVHGMGDPAKGEWYKPVETKIKELYASYPGLKSMYPFDTYFEIKELYYADKFEDLRRRWKSEAKTILENKEITISDNQVAKKLIEATKNLGKNDDFIYTNIMDVIFYRFSSLIRDRIKASLAENIIGQIEDPKVEQWSIIAHSLGTAVIHDTLDAMYKDKGRADIIKNKRPHLITMIANTSRLLQTDIDAYKSVVKPSYGYRDNCACDFYLNLLHSLDIVGIPNKFNPDTTWINHDSYVNNFYNLNNLNHLLPEYIIDQNIASIHSIEHYLENPEVHILLYKLLTSLPFLIPDDEKNKRIKEFNDKIQKDDIKRIRKALQDILPKESANWEEIIKVLFDYFALQQK